MSVVWQRANGGGGYVNGRRNEMFPAARVGAATGYALVEVYNSGPDSVPASKVWLTLDTSGAAVAIALADGVARAASFTYSVDPSLLTYSTPTTKATGLDVPVLASGQKVLLAVRRTLTGATPATPETNSLNLATV